MLSKITFVINLLFNSVVYGILCATVLVCLRIEAVYPIIGLILELEKVVGSLLSAISSTIFS